MKLISVIFVLLSYKNEIPQKLLANDIEKFYGFKINVVVDNIPANSYYPKINRYDANKILEYLKTKYSNQKVIALTSYDIYTKMHRNNYWGIFGLGSLENDVCITSVYRLKSKNLNHRLVNVLLHEVGHTYNIQHCTTKEPCLMKAGDHTAKNLDSTPMKLCTQCKKLIK
jgi:predicted Zn-dependent protease